MLPRIGDPAMLRSAMWCVYLLRCADGTLYTGTTNDLAAREQRHNEGRGARYTAGRRPVRIVYWEPHESRSAAQAREAELKAWTRTKKQVLVADHLGHLTRR